jgi:hypothetical protein
MLDLKAGLSLGYIIGLNLGLNITIDQERLDFYAPP